ncbi:MAG: polyprenyl synthetase family protein [Bacteroidia bacterium]
MANFPYEKLAKEFDKYLSGVIRQLPEAPENLYEPVDYFLSLGGKRLRPLLVLIAGDCFGGKSKNALPAAAAVELFHNFSLIHDDIMDNAPLRRGKQTVHEKWNTNIGILSGDVLLVKAYQQIALCKNVGQLQEIFSKTAIEVCEGQQYDMDFENRPDVSIKEYLKMIRLKTAVLLAASLEMGALCGGAKMKNAKAFYKAGENLGMAFQLTDDYLDVFGNSEKTGKQSGGDIISNKKTWLLIKAFELSNDAQRKLLNDWINKKEFDPVEKVIAVKNIFLELNLHSLLEKQIDSYYKKAFKDLQSACPNKTKITAFTEFTKTLMRRES